MNGVLSAKKCKGQCQKGALLDFLPSILLQNQKKLKEGNPLVQSKKNFKVV